MKIAVSTKDFETVSGHAGQSRRWLIYEFDPASGVLPTPRQVELSKERVFHYFDGKGPHPLDQLAAVITVSAGEGFIGRMAQRGTQVVITGETDPVVAIFSWLEGGEQPRPPFDIRTRFCKLHDFLSRHRRKPETDVDQPC